MDTPKIGRSKAARNRKEPRKRILSVTIKRMYDDSPDTSWLGEYGNSAKTEYAIDRKHSLDCGSVSPEAKRVSETLKHAQETIGDLHNDVLAQYNGTLANEKLDTERDALDDAYDLVGQLAEDIIECDCGERGDAGRNEFRYFNGPVENYEGESPEDIRKYVRQDYERMESLNNGNWCFIGIRADAEIGIPNQYVNCDGKSDSLTIQRITSGGLWGIESDSERTYIEEEEQNQLDDLRIQLAALGFSKEAITRAFADVQHEAE